MALLLPPLAGRERRARAARLRARTRAPRGAPGRTSSAARCARRRACRASPTSSANPTRPKSASVACTTPATSRICAQSRPAPDRDRRAARRDGRDPRRAPDADAARGRRGWPSRRARPRRAARLPRRVRPDGNAQRDDLDPRRPRLGRALLVEELAADAVRIAHEHVRPAAGAAQRAVGHGEVVAHEVELGVAGLGKEHLVAGSRSPPRARRARKSLSSLASP